MNTLSITISPFFLLVACANQEQGSINIANAVTVESNCCCCETPCEDGPCGGDDTGGPELENIDHSSEYSVNLEVDQVDVAFLIDTTGSMGSTANAMADEFGDIVNELASSIPDAAYGYGTFEDYNGAPEYADMGLSDDLPFVLRQQITTDPVPVQAALDVTTLGHGGNVPYLEESTIEALFQALTGNGYDQNGDGELNPDTDVPPFIPSTDDVFSGAAAGTHVSSTVGGGERGGFGFRDGSLPVVVYATDATLRDPDAGYSVPTAATFNAGSGDVANEAAALGARLIAIGVDSEWPGPVPAAAMTQMTDLALATDSLYEADNDGLIDDPLVFGWGGSSVTFQDTIVDAIEGMLDNMFYDSVTAVVVGNTYGFTTTVSPAEYLNVAVGTTPTNLPFVVDIMGSVEASTVDQTFTMTLQIYGNGIALLGTEDLTFIVPASL